MTGYLRAISIGLFAVMIGAGLSAFFARPCIATPPTFTDVTVSEGGQGQARPVQSVVRDVVLQGGERLERRIEPHGSAELRLGPVDDAAEGQEQRPPVQQPGEQGPALGDRRV